jgi:hypothetical protein
VDKDQKLKRDALFCYDLELPLSFIPEPMDGEVESFELQTLDWVLQKIVEGGPNGYKPNCNLVIIDFLIRLGPYIRLKAARSRVLLLKEHFCKTFHSFLFQ